MNTDSLSQFVEEVKEITRDELVLYRGQHRSEPLLPRIARKNPQLDTTETEKQMVAELRRQAGYHLTGQADYRDILVIAQHHGMATRLLTGKAEKFLETAKFKQRKLLFALDSELTTKPTEIATSKQVSSEELINT